MTVRGNHIKQRFEDIYKLHKTKIYNYFYRATGNAEEAKDLTHEVFLKAYKGLKSFNGRSDVSTWIYKIAINTYKDSVRKSSRRCILYLSDTNKEMPIIDKKTLPLKQTEVKELQECMQKFINDLPVTLKTPLILYELQGLKTAEIAKIMNISERNVKIRLIRARKKLKDILCSKCYFFNIKNPCNCKGEDWRAK